MTRRHAFLFTVPCCLVLGGWAIGSEVAAHGASGAVIGGVVGGVLCAGALVALIAARWNRPVSGAERLEIQRAWSRTRVVAIPVGLAGAGIITAIGAAAGDGARGVGSALMCGIGVLIVVGAGIVAASALGRRGLFS